MASSLGFLSEAGLLCSLKLNPLTDFLWSSSLWSIIVFASEIELRRAFVNSIYLHAQMYLGVHLPRCSASRQRVGVNLGVLISCHGVYVLYILPVMPSLSPSLFLSFLPLQRFWMVAFWLTKINFCATLTLSTGATSSKTLLQNSWWYRPTAATLDVSISACPPPTAICQSLLLEWALNYSVGLNWQQTILQGDDIFFACWHHISISLWG